MKNTPCQGKEHHRLQKADQNIEFLGDLLSMLSAMLTKRSERVRLFGHGDHCHHLRRKEIDSASGFERGSRRDGIGRLLMASSNRVFPVERLLISSARRIGTPFSRSVPSNDRNGNGRTEMIGPRSGIFNFQRSKRRRPPLVIVRNRRYRKSAQSDQNVETVFPYDPFNPKGRRLPRAVARRYRVSSRKSVELRNEEDHQHSQDDHLTTQRIVG